MNNYGSLRIYYKDLEDKNTSLENSVVNFEVENKRLGSLLKGKSEINLSQIPLEEKLKKLTENLQAATERNRILQGNLEKKLDLE